MSANHRKFARGFASGSSRFRKRRMRETSLVECLEVRRMPAMFPFTVTIPQIWPINDPDPDPFGTDDGDYFAAVKIGNADPIVSPEKSTDEVLTTTNWVFTAMVDSDAGPTVQVDITLYDDDNFARFENEKIDINPDPAKKGITLFVDLTTGMWTGDVPFGSRETTGAGGNDKATIYFEIDSDSDGLNNRWEYYQGIEIDNDGSIDLPLPGANPNRRDIYVEVDAMAGRAPSPIPQISYIEFPGGGNPVIIWADFHGFSTGDRVSISGPFYPDLNNTYTVTQIDSFKFSLDGTTSSFASVSDFSSSPQGRLIPADVPSNVTLTGTSLDLVAAAFGRSPVPNPDGSTGISLHSLLDETNLALVPWTNDADGDGRTPVGEDVNGDGILNPNEDLNGNGVLDPAEDLNLNSVLDPGEDLNGDGVLNAAEDLNGDGVINPSEDLNNNGVLDDGDRDDQWGDLMFARLKASNFGTPAERAGGPGNSKLLAKSAAYRYGPFVDSFVVPNGRNKGVSLDTSGLFWGGGNDFIVSLGRWGTPGGTVPQQAGTFMHELGHSIGLGHGGDYDDTVNHKPNYYSVMNYSWQTPDINMSSSWRLAYSIGTMPVLDENDLDESAGIGGVSGRLVPVGIGLPVDGTTMTRYVSQTGPIDWNGDGDTDDTGVRADVNFDGRVGSVIRDHNDWANLSLGVAPGTGGVSLDDLEPDLSFEQHLETTQTLFFAMPEGNGDDAVTLLRSGDRIVLIRDSDGAVLASREAARTLSVEILGVGLESDRLTVSFAGGNPIPALGVWFEGGDAAGIDTLAYTGAPPLPPEFVPDGRRNSESGQLRFGASIVRFDGIEKVPGIAPRILTSGLAPAVLDEGDDTVLTVDFLDPGSLSSHRLLVDWGDGTIVTYTLPAGTRSISRAFRMADDIPSFTAADFATIGYRLIDEDDLRDSSTLTVLVRNVAPEISQVAVTPEIDENGVVTLTGEIVDPGTEDVFLLVVDWGEGAPVSYSYAAGTTSFVLTHQYLDDDPTSTASDFYTIALLLKDDDLGQDFAGFTTVVKNVAPVLSNVSVTPVIDETGTVTLSGDISDVGTLDTFILVVDWGEGAPVYYDYPAGTTSFVLTHQYLDDDPTATASDFYTIALLLKDDDSGEVSATVTTVVNNVAPVLTSFESDARNPGDVVEGDLVTVTGSFFDLGTEDTHSATIDWGDGSSSPASIVQYAGGGTFSASHSYDAGGVYRIIVTLTDDDTGKETLRSYVFVTGVGIVDGVLHVVGTAGADSVTISRQGNGDFRVIANFLADSPRTLTTQGVASIAMLLGEGDDHAQIAASIELPSVIDGGSGNDRITGANGPNLILGGEGNDVLIGGSSHDILVGGLGADRIIGNGGDDILIAGTLTLPNDPLDLFDESLDILLEWERFRLMSRTRRRLLTHGDGSTDLLTGGAGFDWFFLDPEDIATDRKNEFSGPNG